MHQKKYTCHQCGSSSQHHERFRRCDSCGTVACDPGETGHDCAGKRPDGLGDWSYWECPECHAFDTLLPLERPRNAACPECRETAPECSCERQDEEGHPEWLRAGREVVS